MSQLAFSYSLTTFNNCLLYTSVLLRKSGTEPVIRVTVEARGKDLCRTLVDKIADTIVKKGYEVK